MKPEITGKGMGTEIVKSILDFGRQTYNFQSIELLVAKCNKRAIRIYEKLGIVLIDEFIWKVWNSNNERFRRVVWQWSKYQVKGGIGCEPV